MDDLFGFPLFQWDEGSEDYADFLERLPPELVTRLAEGQATVGTPEKGYQLVTIYKNDGPEGRDWLAKLASYNDTDELREALGDLIALQMVIAAMSQHLVMRAIEVERG